VARFAIVDMNNLYYRAAKATQGDAFTRMGMSIHIAFQSFRRMMEHFHCDHIVVCTEGRSWRHSVYPPYKAKRRLEKANRTLAEREEDDVLLHGLNDLIDFIDTKTKMTVLRGDNVEGDDLIARFIKVHPSDEHIILSSDSDFIQLIADNVKIYDAMLDRVISKEGVRSAKDDRPLVFAIKPGDGKITIKGSLVEEAEKHKREQKELKKANPDHVPIPYEWSIDEDWWKRALFIKLVRGDSGDGVFSAYPGVRYKGTKSKVGIEQAWADREAKGFEWNNFMNQEWQKLDGSDENGDPIMKPVTVKEEFERNRMLIDLTQQPKEIVEAMDRIIVEAIQKVGPSQVGVHFLKFCGKHQLAKLSQEATFHGRYLNSGYPMGG
jgi:hypothetical protein